MKTGTYAVVCTEKRGVFAGVIENQDEDKGTITLKDARMCVYWCADVKGVLGLASKGPVYGCRITDATPSIDLVGVTAVIECSKEAKEAWKKGLWS